jgi:rare lipoprotein A
VNPRPGPRAGFRIALLAVCLGSTGTAYAATTAQSGNVSMARGGQSARVAYGHAVHVEGRVTGAPGTSVRLEYAPAGEEWRPAAQTTSGDDGSYRFAVRAERSGAYRAVSAVGASAPRRVTVVARIGGRATRHARRGEQVRVRGALRPGKAGRTVHLQLRIAARWRTVDRDRTSSGGRYATTWRPPTQGAYRLRVRFAGDRANGEVTRKLRGRVNVYRPSAASWYGPGFYGSRRACGQTTSSSILGVANKSLPCDTRVTMRYHGRSVTVPVIDRGPFSGAREWDLTPATKERLGFGSTGTVWVTR